MNYPQDFNNNSNYMMPYNPYGYFNVPVMGVSCLDSMAYMNSMPYMTSNRMPGMPNMPGSMPSMPNMPTMPNMPNMPNMPGSMPGMPNMPEMPSNNMPFIPDTEMPGIPNFPDGDMPAMPEDMMQSPGMPINCQQLMEFVKRMNCMEYMKQTESEEKK